MPAPVAGRYSLYKAGTQKVTQWLTEAARSSTSGKNRVKLIASATTLDLVRLAETIANAQEPVSVPRNILHLLDDVITGGSRVSNAPSIVDVLRKISTLLQAAFERQNLASSHASSEEPAFVSSIDGQPQESLTNLFAHLDLEEPTAAPLGSEPKKRHGTSTEANSASSDSKQAEQDDCAESELALWCFLQDMNDMRQSITTTWTEHLGGDVSFFVTTCVMDTAFGIMRRSNNDLTLARPESADTSEMLRFLGVEVCTYETKPCIATADTHEPLAADSPLSQALCPLALLSMTVFSASFTGQPCTISEIVEEREDHMDALQWSCLPSIQAKASKLAMTSSTARKSRRVVRRVRGRLPGSTSDQNLAPWLVIACQAYIEVFDMNPKSPLVGIKELSEEVRRIDAIFDAYEAFQDRGGCDKADGLMMASTPDQHEEKLDMNRALCHDAISSALETKEGMSIGKHVSTVGRNFWFPAGIWRNLFLTPAIRMHEHKVTMHREGISLLNHGQIVGQVFAARGRKKARKLMRKR